MEKIEYENSGTAKAKILVVEDNPDLLHTLSFTLEHSNFSVSQACTGQEARRLLKSDEPFDLILLDVMLPDDSGYELCRHIREKEYSALIPLIFLSAKSQEIDKVVGFESGADDYITKPFSVKELVLRINAVLRRNRRSHTKSMRVGLISLEPHLPRVLVEQREISLTSLELRLLSLLMERKGRVQSRMQLLCSVWKIHAEVTTRTVDTHIKRLREKLGTASFHIKTVRGMGYRLLTSEEISKMTSAPNKRNICEP